MPSSPSSPPSANPRWFDTLLLGLLFFGAYEVLRQTSVPGDGTTLLDLTWKRHVGSDNHFLYLPLTHALRGVLDARGWSVFEILSHLSCVAAALAVALTHLGFRILRLSRGSAAAATALLGAMPGMVFYATTVELHALFMAVAGMAFVTAAALAMRPGPLLAAALGATTGIAYCAHATGILLPLPLLALALGAARDRHGALPITRLAGLGAVTGLVHSLGVWGLPWALRALHDGVTVDPLNNQSWIANHSVGGWHNLHLGFVTLWNEWLFAALPISITWLLGFARRETRMIALGVLVALLPYLGISFVLLADWSERGAYLLPLAWPAAWLAVRSGPRLAVLAQIGIAVTASMLAVFAHDEPERSRAFAHGLRAAAGDAPIVVLTGGANDVAACFSHLPDALYLRLERLALDPQAGALLPILDEYVAQWFADGHRVFLSSETETFARPGLFLGSATLAEVILPHLEEQYEQIEVRRDGFSGVELRPRP